MYQLVLVHEETNFVCCLSYFFSARSVYGEVSSKQVLREDIEKHKKQACLYKCKKTYEKKLMDCDHCKCMAISCSSW